MKRFYVIISLFFVVIFFVLFISILWYTKVNRDILNFSERQWLKSRGNRIIYGAHINAPPLRYLDEKDGQYKGLVIDYLHAMSLELGIDVETHPYIWKEALENLAKGQTDLCDMFPSIERSKKYLFTKPIYNLRGVFAVRGDNKTINAPDDIKNIVVALEKGDYTNEFFTIHYPDVKIIYTDDVKQALNLLIDGKVQGVAGDELVVLDFIKRLNERGKIRVLDSPLYELPVVFAVSKTSPILVSILNKGIDRINKTNTLEKIQQKWFGLSTSIIVPNQSQKKIIRYTAALGLIFIFLSILFFYINLSLKREIQLRTRQLLQAQKMAAIGQLAAGVAHEIRNPLGIIRTYVFIMENKIKAMGNFQQFEKPINTINNAVERASKIIDNLLNLSQISDYKFSWVRLDNLISDIIELPLKEMVKKKIECSMDINNEYEYWTCPDSLRHIILNIISNAIDAIKEDGRLKIVVKDIVSGFEIICEDTGVGIKDEHIDHIFNPFFTTKTPGHGTGLGLYITYNEVNKLNGEIKVFSKEGEGTTFSIKIPAKKRRYDE